MRRDQHQFLGPVGFEVKEHGGPFFRLEYFCFVRNNVQNRIVSDRVVHKRQVDGGRKLSVKLFKFFLKEFITIWDMDQFKGEVG